MAKRMSSPRQARRQPTRQTNWLLIGGVAVAGVVALLALLILAVREPEPQTLANFCSENLDNCFAKGVDDAPVTIVEVSDYGCSHCRDFNLETAGLIEDLLVTPGKVQWIVLPFALGTRTAPAASAAMCAADQERFFEYHKRLFEIQGGSQSLNEAAFLQAAADLGLDKELFSSCLASGRHDSQIRQNMRAASLSGVKVTPSIFINGLKVEGNQPLTTFQQQISNLLGNADAD